MKAKPDLEIIARTHDLIEFRDKIARIIDDEIPGSSWTGCRAAADRILALVPREYPAE